MKLNPGKRWTELPNSSEVKYRTSGGKVEAREGEETSFLFGLVLLPDPAIVMAPVAVAGSSHQPLLEHSETPSSQPLINTNSKKMPPPQKPVYKPWSPFMVLVTTEAR